ncbi:MAG: LysM peptidoglycan-binding domain-containing protein [Verrucomicrobiota bacterium]
MLLRIGICVLWLNCFAWGEVIHRVQKGDTLTKISAQYGVSQKAILQTNPDVEPNNIRIGQRLKIPVPTATPSASSSTSSREQRKVIYPSRTRPSLSASNVHTIQKGDTLIKIARMYGLSLDQLRQINNLQSDVLYIGQKLLIQPLAQTSPVAKKQTYVFISKVRAKIDAPRRLRPWKYIVVHHSGTANGNAKIFDYYHSKICRMENGLAYHFIIGNGTDSGDGEIEVGSRWMKQLQGGHVSDERVNEVGIGICLVGNYNKTRPTSRQIASLVELLSYLKAKMPNQKLAFHVHREVVPNHTDCPGRFFPSKAIHNLFDSE